MSDSTDTASVAPKFHQLATARGYEIQTVPHSPFVTIVANADSLKAYLFELKAGGFAYLADVMGIDYLEYTSITPKRLAVVYNLVNLNSGERVLVKVFVTEHEKLPTVTDLWATADFHEREVFDLMGIVFEDHPDLRKILTPEDLDGHPLRKDFPLGESPTLFGEGRFLDPAAFRAGLSGKDTGLTGWRGGNRIDSSLAPKLPTAVPTGIKSGEQ